MAQALHIQLRKKLTLFMQSTLKKIFLDEPKNSAIDTSSIKKILVVRINYRIGNILFTTPLLNALYKQFPNAQIDMIIGAPFITPLIEGMPHINKVYSFDRKLLKHPLQVLKLRKEINKNNYDLMILSSGLSTSDTLISWLIDATYKIGFFDKNSFKKLTHAVSAPKDVQHEALIPLSIMQYLGASDEKEFNHYLDIQLSDEEKNIVDRTTFSNTIGIFRDARGEKKIDNEWWEALLDALQTLDENLCFIDILDPGNPVALNAEIQTLSQKNLRVLAAHIANLNAFICGDTGPMHLASAAGTPTIALFKTTSPSNYGTLGKNDYSLLLKDKEISEIAKSIYAHIQKVNEI